PVAPKAIQAILAIPSCAAYIKALRCYASNMPERARGPTLASVKIVLRQMAKTQVDKRERGCSYALRRWKEVMKDNPTAKGCLK
ncbi:hypothetical protein ACFL51_00005, partial [Myxococcota bacterium]